MNTFFGLQENGLVIAIGWTLFHFIWQGALIGLITGGLRLILKNATANIRYLVSCAGLLVMALAFVATLIALFSLTNPNADHTLVAHSVTGAKNPINTSATAQQPVDSPDQSSLDSGNNRMAASGLQPQPTSNKETTATATKKIPFFGAKTFLKPLALWLVLVWVLGVSLCTLRLLVGWTRVQRMRGNGLSQLPHLTPLVMQTAHRLGISRDVKVFGSTLVDVPTLIGWLRPIILLPAAALMGLSTSQLRAIIAHELAHVRRADYIVNLVQSVIETLLFYHPAVWWLSNRIRNERENCCDDIASAICGDASFYANALVQMEELRPSNRLPTSIALSSQTGILWQRIARLVGKTPTKQTSPNATLSVIAVAITLLATLGVAANFYGSSQPNLNSEFTATSVSARAMTENTPTRNAGEDDDDKIVWGKKSESGWTAGISIEKPKKSYQFGDVIKVRYFARNDSGNHKKFGHPRFLSPQYFEVHCRSQDGKRITPRLCKKNFEVPWIAGWTLANLRPGDSAELHGASIQIGGKDSKPSATNVGYFLDLAPNKKYELRFSLPDYSIRDATTMLPTGMLEINTKPKSDKTTSNEKKDKSGKQDEKDDDKKNKTDALDKDVKDKKTKVEKRADKPVDAQPVTIRGKVVDDETGKPIKGIMVQAGRFDPSAPGGFNEAQVKWGWSEMRTGGDSFTRQIQWHKGWTARVVVDGYVPQPILVEPPDPKKREIAMTVRMKRGRILHGRVVDHQGDPVVGASVYPVTPARINVYQGKAMSQHERGEDKQARGVKTNKEGIFELPSGNADAIVVTSKSLDAFAVPVTTADKEKVAADKKGKAADELLKIKLPQPAKIVINFDIKGAEKEMGIFYQMLNYQKPGFKRVDSTRTVPIDNQGQLVLDSLTPGLYQFWRNRSLPFKEMGRTGALDRIQIELKPGQTYTWNLVRKHGAQVQGKFIWPKDTEFNGVIVRVQSLPDPKTNKIHNFKIHNFDARVIHGQPDSDPTQEVGENYVAEFQTELLEPGEYLIVTESYAPLTDFQKRSTGWIMPSHIAQKKITIPDMGGIEPVEIKHESVKK